MPVVLLVDDEAPVRRLLADLLEAEGYEVVEAETGVEGLKRFRQHLDQTGLVVADLTMPGLSGRAMAAAMQAIRPAVPVLFVAGYTREEAIASGMLPADAAFLAKPFHLDDVVERVAALCR